MNIQIRKASYLKLISLFFLTLFSCKEEVSENTIDPANLTVEINVSEDGTGAIEIIAAADNTTFYEFYVGDALNTKDPITNTEGVFNYTYTLTGLYDVEVRAYGSSGRYLNKEIQIYVEVDDSGTPIPADGYSTPLSYPNMNLVWQDEFNGSVLNTADWSYDIGDGCPNLCGWGNNELEYYREENASFADGYLIIEAKKEDFGGKNYTSSKLKTKGKKEFKYGRIDIRAVLPEGQGLWPALWMIGTNISTVGWPACGEIDIMEMIGGGDGRDNKSYGTIHWDSNGYASTGGNYTLPSGKFSEKFHVFTIIWNSSSITWFVDDVKFRAVDITSSLMSEFHQEAYLIFNVAVGGNWPGSPNETTVFPQQMVVDYIRVFQDK